MLSENRVEIMSHLLVLAPNYQTFIKDRVEAIAEYWDQITVLIRYNPFISLLDGLHKNRNIALNKENLVDYTNLPSNIRIKVYKLAKFREDRKGDFLGKSIGNRILKIVKNEGMDIDIIHSHFTYPMGYAGTIVSRELNVPNVITAHGYDVYDLPYRNNSMRNAVRHALNGTDHIITVSKKNVEHITAMDINTRVSIIPNGFRDDKFHIINSDLNSLRNELDLPCESKILLTVGNLKEIKGHNFLIEALKYVSEERDDIYCCIIGHGPLFGVLNNKIVKLKLKSKCSLRGSKPHNEIPKWMNACDLFVLPSLNEGNPTVMFETMACGKPFIGTNVGGIPEIIDTDDYGLLCEPGNPRELANNILIALDKDWDINKILEKSKNYTWNRLAKETQKIYQDLI